VRTILVALTACVLAGCADYHYHAGRFQEGRRRGPQALEHYEAFLGRQPRDPRAAELHVRAGWIYAQMDRCLEARRHYEAAAREFPKLEPWAARAKAGVMSCPDFFPLTPGRAWVYGDSASGGKAMRLEWRIGVSSGAGASMTQALFAGSKRLRSQEVEYEWADWTLWQREKDGRVAVLPFPHAAGARWTARRDGKLLQYRVERDDAVAKTAAGTFEHCLKVRESDPGYKDAWKYDYYCPSVGRALTTVAGSDFENPNTELLSYTR
jgi:tetratricopeptide (TPR) repeat protein